MRRTDRQPLPARSVQFYSLSAKYTKRSRDVTCLKEDSDSVPDTGFVCSKYKTRLVSKACGSVNF